MNVLDGLVSDVGIGHIASAIGAVISGLVALIVHGISKSQDDVKKEIECACQKVQDHEVRVSVLEKTILRKEDLEGVYEALERDLKAGFVRAHERIDILYHEKNSKYRDRES